MAKTVAVDLAGRKDAPDYGPRATELLTMAHDALQDAAALIRRVSS